MSRNRLLEMMKIWFAKILLFPAFIKSKDPGYLRIDSNNYGVIFPRLSA